MIHHGVPSQAGNFYQVKCMDFKKKVGDATNRLKGLVSGASESVSNTADRLMLEMREVNQTISSLGSTQIEQRIDRVFPKTRAPAYILHHSNGADDYSVHFDLSDVLARLDDGVLARPGIVLYAGRSDIDRGQLSERVSAEFLAEMKKHEQRVKELAREGERVQRDALDRSISTVIGGAAEAAFMHVLLLLVTGPLGILVLLLMGSFNRTIDAISELVSMPAKLVRAGAETVTQPFNQRRINSAIEEEQQKINKALGNLELTMHRDLIVLASSFDNLAYPFRGNRDTGDLPEHIVQLIRAHGGDYLPDRY